MPLIKYVTDTASAGQWRLQSIEGSANNAGFKIVRRSENLHEAAMDTLSVLLSSRRVLANPQADGQTYSGSFVSSRIVPKRQETQDYIIDQQLTKVRSSVPETSWNLSRIEKNPLTNANELVRSADFVNPFSADTLIATYTGKTVVNPKADSKAYTGMYVITGARGEVQEDGSIKIFQSMIQSWNDTRTDSSIRGAFSISHLGMQDKHFDYHNYLASALPIDPGETGGFKFIQKRIEVDKNGIASKVIIHEAPAPSNVVTGGIPAVSDTLGLTATGSGSDTLAQTGREKTVVAERINPILAPSIVANWGKDTGGYIVSDISTADNGDGSGNATRRLFKYNAKGAYFIHKSCDSSAGRVPSGARTWPFIKDTLADKIMGSGGAAREGWGTGGDTWAAGLARRTIHFGLGLSTVEQESQDKNLTGQAGLAWRNFTDSYREYKPQWRRIRVSGIEKDQLRIHTLAYRIRQTTNKDQAYGFLRSDTTAMKKRKPVTCHVEDKSVGYFARYRAIAIYESVDSWTNANNPGYADVGSKTNK